MHLRQLLLVSMTIGALLSSNDLRDAIAGEGEKPAPTQPPDGKNAGEEKKQVPPVGTKVDPDAGFWKNVGFGVGVSYTQTFGKDRINSAQIVNGTVRINEAVSSSKCNG